MTFDDLLDLLGHKLVALCWKQDGSEFRTIITPPAGATAQASILTDADVWFSINEPAGPARQGPRGGAEAITRHTSLWADLDVKEGAFATEDDARAVIDDLAIALNTDPAAIIHSGHGLQPLWIIEDDAAVLGDPDRRALAQTVLARWRRLVETISARRGAAVDAVFDLPRILRAPGTVNHKGEPVPTSVEQGSGAPLSYSELFDVFDAYGIAEMTSDALLDEPVDTSAWTWRDTKDDCPYVATMIRGWSTDNPDARHPWLLAQATRLACAHRAGCLTAADHQKAIGALVDRMQQLCASGSNARAVAPSEVRSALDWGTSRASLLSDDQLQRELGGHDLTHSPRLTVVDGGDNVTRLAGLGAPEVTTTTDGALATVSTPALTSAGQPPRVTLTDDGNARLFVHQHGHRLRYSAARGWLEWTGTHWHISEDDSPAIQSARGVAGGLDEDSKETAKHKARSLSKAGIENMVALARRDPVIRITADELDAHRMQLNTPSGTLDLTTGNVHEHRQAELHTKITGVGVDASIQTPRWLRYLDDTFGGDQEMIDFLQRLLGYAITGRVTHHILPFFHGDGQNGKSVLTDVLFGILGDYAVVIPSSVLIAHRYSHDTELSKLPGARVAISSEVPTDGTFDEERVKALTGGDKISARELYKNPFEFTPSHTLILAGNHQPSVESGGKSFWRRTRLIPFEHTVPEERKVEGLGQILVEEEGPGILAWIAAGTIAARDGLAEPAAVMAATREYEQEEDALGTFVTDCLHVSRADNDLVKVKTTDLRRAYSSWCRDNGIAEMSAKMLTRELVRRTGARPTRDMSARYYVGIALIETDRTEDESRYGS